MGSGRKSNLSEASTCGSDFRPDPTYRESPAAGIYFSEKSGDIEVNFRLTREHSTVRDCGLEHNTKSRKENYEKDNQCSRSTGAGSLAGNRGSARQGPWRQGRARSRQGDHVRAHGREAQPHGSPEKADAGP